MDIINKIVCDSVVAIVDCLMWLAYGFEENWGRDAAEACYNFVAACLALAIYVVEPESY